MGLISMHVIKRISCIITAALIAVNITGCGAGNLSKEKAVKANKELDERLDGIISTYSDKNGDKSSIEKEFDEANDTDKAAFAIDLADDMAMARLFDTINSNFLVLSAKAVKKYPHPLVLNNFAALLVEEAPEDALYLLLQALDNEPEEPILLTNIANMYISLGDFKAAERYAKKALAAMPGFGPAYQVLTTIHLKNNNSPLAAETMVKSAKDNFTDITMYHFESFLEAVKELDPEVDEYPLKEEFIKELYEIAKTDVSTEEINSSMDTPEGQIKIKPFPRITGADDLMKSEDYLAKECGEISDKYGDMQTEYYDNYSEAFENYVEDTDRALDGTYPVKMALRQGYAFRVLQSYYTFKLEKNRKTNQKKLEKFLEKDREENNRIEEAYKSREEKVDNTIEHLEGQIVDLTPQLPDAGAQALIDSLDKQIFEEAFKGAQIRLEMASQIRNTGKANALTVLNMINSYYNDQKQLLEEYYLRSNGLIKYVPDEKILRQFDLERGIAVYDYIGMPLNDLIEISRLVGDYQYEWDTAKYVVEEYASAAEIPESKKESYDFDGGDAVPEIERMALTKFQEKNELKLPDIGFDASLPFFGASIKTDGEKLKIGLDTPFGTFDGAKNLLDGGSSESYVVYGGKFSTDILKLGGMKVGGVGGSGGVREGRYVAMDSNGKVTDYGIVHIREIGGDYGALGATKKVTVLKSAKTGIAIKSTTINYRFMFAGVETRAD